MQSRAYTIVDDVLLTSPAYESLSRTAALILIHIVRCLKRAFRQGRLDEDAMGWIDFPLSMLPFRVHPRTWTRALRALESNGIIMLRRSPGRPFRIAMSTKWRAIGPLPSPDRAPAHSGAHHLTTLAPSATVPENLPSDSPLKKASNQDTTIRNRDGGGQPAVDSKKPEEPERPPEVDEEALCRSLGDVAGPWGRDNVRRAIAGKPRSLIVRAYNAVKASRGVRSTTALFIYRLENGWLPSVGRARTTERPPCEEPSQVGAIAQRLALQMASASGP